MIVAKYVNKDAKRWITIDKLDESVYGKNMSYCIKQYEERDDFAQTLRISETEMLNMTKTLEQNGWIKS